MAVLSLALTRRYLITCLFAKMPGGHSRRCFSERFRFQPKPREHVARGFKRMWRRRLSYPEILSINIDEGAVGSSAVLKDATFIWKMQCRRSWVLLKTHFCGYSARKNMMQSSEILYQYCDGVETFMEGDAYKVEPALFLCGLLGGF